MLSSIIMLMASCLSLALATNVPVTQVAKTTAASQDERAAKSLSGSQDERGSLLDRMPILELLKNPKVVDGYTGCLLEKGPCTPDAAEVKGLMTDALTQGCSKCTPIQKQVTDTLMLHYSEKSADTLKQVTAKYDPKGEFSKKYLATLKKKTVKKE